MQRYLNQFPWKASVSLMASLCRTYCFSKGNQGFCELQAQGNLRTSWRNSITSLWDPRLKPQGDHLKSLQSSLGILYESRTTIGHTLNELWWHLQGILWKAKSRLMECIWKSWESSEKSDQQTVGTPGEPKRDPWETKDTILTPLRHHNGIRWKAFEVY